MIMNIKARPLFHSKEKEEEKRKTQNNVRNS